VGTSPRSVTSRHSRRARASALCTAAAACATFAGVAIIAAGGGIARLRVVSIGLQSPWPAVGAGFVLGAAAWWLSRAARQPVDRDPAPAPRDHTPATKARPALALAAVALALCTALVAWAYGTESAVGADASGYLNAARLFAAARTSVAVPLAADAPWPDALATMAPLGFRPGTAPNAIVPTYAPGLPLALAAAMRAGPHAWTLVVPVFAGLAVLATFLVGAQAGSSRAALVAACGVAASPVFLFHAIQPMSDVPTTALWMLALACAMPRHTAWAVASGVCTSAAILTRPNLAPLAVAVAAVLVVTGRRDDANRRQPASDAEGAALRRPVLALFPRLALFAAATLPGVAGAAWLNEMLYGHPFVSGYGTTGDLFSLASVPTNVARYTGWAIDVHPVSSLLLVVFVVVTLLRWRTGTHPSVAAAVGARPLTLALAGFVVLNVGAYLVYAPFENWTYLRFLLPAFPLAALAASSVVETVVSRAEGARDVASPLRRAVATAVLCGLVTGLGIRDAAARGVFERRAIEARHELLAHAYAPRAASTVFITQQHGGAMRFHLGATVVRWDLIDPAALDGAMAWLSARGLAPVILLDADEEPEFRARFAGRGAWAPLDWPARFETAPPQRARAFELADRASFERGGTWRPTLLPPPRR
jgi:hypothetical protein